MKDISIEIEKIIKEYTAEVEEGIERVVEADTKEAVKELQNTSPKKTGEYARGWTVKKEKKQGEIKMIVYNKKKPQLTHLREFGHAKRGGGRVPAHPHIAPVEQKLNEQIVRDIEEVIRNGG